MGLSWAEHSEQIAASPEECFEAITDYETMPKWQSAVLGTEVTKRERRSKLGTDVRFEVDGKVRKIRYTLRYSYDRPGLVTWDFLEGEGIKQLDGEWTFKESNGGTEATYKTGVDPGGGVPGPVVKRVNKGTVKRAVEDLKAEAEQRAGTGGGGSASGGDDSPLPFEMLPEPIEKVARLPGRIMVGIGKRLGG